jgi:hypothetical protein
MGDCEKKIAKGFVNGVSPRQFTWKHTEFLSTRKNTVHFNILAIFFHIKITYRKHKTKHDMFGSVSLGRTFPAFISTVQVDLQDFH